MPTASILGISDKNMFSRFTVGIKKSFQRSQLTDNEIKVWQQFQIWYSTSLGQRLAHCEKQILDKVLPDLFGYFLLQCGYPEINAKKKVGNWLETSRVSTQFRLDYPINQDVSCYAHLPQLPIKTDSIDIVILPHVLEFSSEPHQILREAERILIAEGHVVILGFNPWSIWNIFRLFLFWKKQAPWSVNFFTASRVMDWLALLGFDVIQRHGYFYQPPIQSENIIKKMGFFDKMGKRFWPKLGAGYVLVARKRVQTLTPIRQKWRTQRKVATHGLETTNRNKF